MSSLCFLQSTSLTASKCVPFKKLVLNLSHEDTHHTKPIHCYSAVSLSVLNPRATSIGLKVASRSKKVISQSFSTSTQTNRCRSPIPCSELFGKPVLLLNKKPEIDGKQNRRVNSLGPVCAVDLSSINTLQWIHVVASLFLMVAAKTPIYKQLLVPLLALHMPGDAVSWIKGEYGLWTAFVAVLVRLFYGIPGQLELPFAALLTVLAAPGQVMDFRRSPAAAIVGIAAAAYVAYTHFRDTKSVNGSLTSRVLPTTLGVAAILIVPISLVIQGYA